MKHPQYEVDGLNRGGKEHFRLLLPKLNRSGRRSRPEFHLRDPEHGRAAAIIPYISQHGLTATAHEDRARLSSKSDIRVLAIDAVSTMRQIVEQPIPPKKRMRMSRGISIDMPIKLKE